jgi:hypothetical protein
VTTHQGDGAAVASSAERFVAWHAKEHPDASADSATSRALTEAARQAWHARDREVAGLRGLVGALWLYVGHHTETQLTTPQKELLYDVVEQLQREEGD